MVAKKIRAWILQSRDILKNFHSKKSNLKFQSGKEPYISNGLTALNARITCDINIVRNRRVQIYVHGPKGEPYSVISPNVKSEVKKVILLLTDKFRKKNIPITSPVEQEKKLLKLFSEEDMRMGERILLEGRYLEELGKWGYERGLENGEKYYINQGKAALLSRVGWIVDKQSKARMRPTMNILSSGGVGTGKGHDTETFFGLNDQVGLEVLPRERWIIIEPGEVSSERFRGDVVIDMQKNLKVLWPYPAIADFIVIQEPDHFLGSGDKKIKMLSQYNQVVETRWIWVGLIKGGFITKKKFDKWVQRLPHYLRSRVKYDGKNGRIGFKAVASYVMNMNLSEQRDFKWMAESGFFSRQKCLSRFLSIKDRFDEMELLLQSRKKHQTRSSLGSVRYASYIVAKSSFIYAEPPSNYLLMLLKRYRKMFFKEINDEVMQKFIVNKRTVLGEMKKELTARAMEMQWKRLKKRFTISGEQMRWVGRFDEVSFRKEDFEYVRDKVLPEMIDDGKKFFNFISGAEEMNDIRGMLLRLLPSGGTIKTANFYEKAIKLGLSKRQIQRYVSRMEGTGEIDRKREGKDQFIFRCPVGRFHKRRRTKSWNNLNKPTLEVTKQKHIKARKNNDNTDDNKRLIYSKKERAEMEVGGSSLPSGGKD